MKKLLLLAVVLGSMLLGGCGTLVLTPEERARQHRLITDLQSRMVVDDWDYIWLYEKNSRLTRYHPRVGM